MVDVPLRGPRSSAIGDDIEAVRSWIAALEAGSRGGTRYALRYAPIGGRLIGRNELPSRAIVDSYEQAIALLGVGDKVRSYKTVLSVVVAESAVSAWVAAYPLRALEVADSWPTVMSAYYWLQAARDSGRYLREITAPGVDTKFVERHRLLLAQLLDVPSSASGFLGALGLRAKPETLRLRPDPSLGVATGLSDLTARVDELATLSVSVRLAVVIENEITFLSVPVPRDGVVLWGKGFEVDRVGSMPWLAHADVAYWGDLDTHGFAILNQLRAWLPQTRSLLMDRETLTGPPRPMGCRGLASRCLASTGSPPMSRTLYQDLSLTASATRPARARAHRLEPGSPRGFRADKSGGETGLSAS